MKHYFVFYISSVVAVVLSIPNYGAQSSDARQAVTQKLQDRKTGVERSLDQEMERFHVPAISMAVIDGGRLAWSHAWGVARIEGARPRSADTRTLFQAASLSKVVTALGVLHLFQSGKLPIDNDVNEILSGWKLPKDSYADSAVTVREILCHSAGISVHGFLGYRSNRDVPGLIQILNGLPPANSPPIRVETKPNTKWQYSGGGYLVLQQLVVQLSHHKFADYMKASVLDRLQMTASTYEQPLPVTKLVESACGHDVTGTQLPGCANIYPEQAAAGLWTTPTELAQVVLFLQGRVASSRPLVADQLRSEMLSRHMSDWGLGIGLRGAGPELRFWHGGSNEGFKAILFGYAHTGQGAVIMANGDGGVQLIQELLHRIALVYKWPTPHDLP